jgi:hypothetical protein
MRQQARNLVADRGLSRRVLSPTRAAGALEYGSGWPRPTPWKPENEAWRFQLARGAR